MKEFELQELPYEYSALEPHIDEMTMRIHHTKHHAAYAQNFNAALSGQTGFDGKSAEEILKEIGKVPEAIRTAVRNNGGGYVNHNLFWTVLSPKAGGEPQDMIGEAIKKKFGSFAAFKEAFSNAAKTRFGSGWAWLVLDKNGEIEIYSTANQDSPIMESKVPLLALDVWEHAYYLKYQNRRPEYIEAFWNLVHWKEVNRRLAEAKR
jgi:superoxide dismutase, Fe-Mn family